MTETSDKSIRAVLGEDIYEREIKDLRDLLRLMKKQGAPSEQIQLAEAIYQNFISERKIVKEKLCKRMDKSGQRRR